MSDDVEIDLRHVISVVISKVTWIFAFSVILGLVVFLYFFLQPEKFAAQALISVIEPCTLQNLDQAGQAIINNPIDNGFAIDIAQSQEVTASLLQHGNKSFEIEDFTAKKGNDSRILMLIVENESSEEAIRLVGLWAGQVVQRINSLFIEQDNERLKRLEFFENQIQDSNLNLRKIQNTLAALGEQNAIFALEEQYNSLLQLQKEHLYQDQLLVSLKADANALLKESESLNKTDLVPAEMQIRLLALQLRQYSDTVHADYRPLPLSELSTISTGDFQQSIYTWLKSLEEKLVQNKKLLAQYALEITTIQVQIKSYNDEKDLLILDQKGAMEAHTDLLQQRQEIAWHSQECEGKEGAKIIAQANPISQTSLTKKIAYGIVATVVGAVLAATFFLFLDWWRSATKNPK